MATPQGIFAPHLWQGNQRISTKEGAADPSRLLVFAELLPVSESAGT